MIADSLRLPISGSARTISGEGQMTWTETCEGVFVQTAPGQEQISIAVVVPNYNHGRFLPASLSSIAKQTRQPDEVLIIDDGSIDDSVDVITRFLSSHPTWRLIRHSERRGVVKRLNEGVDKVRSNWVTLLGADDVLDPKYLELAEQMAALHPAVGLICGCVEIFGLPGGRKLRPPILPHAAGGYVSPDGFRGLLRGGDNYFLGTTTMYRRKTITDLGGFDEKLGSICDGFLARQIAARHGFAFIPEVLGYWRMHGENYSVSTATDPQAVSEGVQAVGEALSREPAGLFPSNYRETFERRFRFGGARLIIMDRNVPARVRAARIAALVYAGPFERLMLAGALAAGTPGAIAALAWLAIRLRPLSVPLFLRHLPMRHAILAAAKGPPYREE